MSTAVGGALAELATAKLEASVRRRGRPPKAAAALQPAKLPTFDAKVQKVLDELVDVYRYLTAKGLPDDLVKDMVLHHQSFYLERM